MNTHKSNKIKENSNTVRHLIMGQIITTQNLVAIKVVQHAGQQNLVRVPPERVHSVFNQPWGDKPANNKETYGLSTLGAGSDLSRTFFLITCTMCFTRLLTSVRRYIQRLVSMSIADGLASTNLLLLYILAINLHICVLCFENTRYIWIRQRLLVTWCISHVGTSATMMFMVVRTHDRSHLNVNPRHRLSISS